MLISFKCILGSIFHVCVVVCGLFFKILSDKQFLRMLGPELGPNCLKVISGGEIVSACKGRVISEDLQFGQAQ